MDATDPKGTNPDFKPIASWRRLVWKTLAGPDGRFCQPSQDLHELPRINGWPLPILALGHLRLAPSIVGHRFCHLLGPVVP